MPERTRVSLPTGNRNIDTTVDFQREDRAKKLNLQQARSEIKRSNINHLNQKIFD
jgi:hypothetical protein